MILTYKYSKDKKGDLKNAHHMMDSWYGIEWNSNHFLVFINISRDAGGDIRLMHRHDWKYEQL